MINAAELLDTALWALTTQSMGAAIDVIMRGLEVERERERKACAALVYEYGDMSAYEAILRRNKGPLFRDEKGS